MCTYKLQPSEDLTRATSLNIASLSKDRHFCVFCLSFDKEICLSVINCFDSYYAREKEE